MIRRVRLIFIVALLLSATLESALAATCLNRFMVRRQQLQQTVTLLTGKLTFQEAQELAKNINEKKAPPIEWVDDAGKTISKQFGELKVVRPMPVGCDGKTSGVVMIVTFVSPNSPVKKMNVKLGSDQAVVFDQQAD
jgi:hypothetical protein